MGGVGASNLGGSTVSISIYLVRSVQENEVNQAFASRAAVPIATFDGVTGNFYALPSDPKEPQWLASVKSLLAPNSVVQDVTSQMAGGLLLVTTGGRLFAVSFGNGWLRLNEDWLEVDFGRQVALNSIPQDKLVEVRAEQVFARRHVSSERAPTTSNKNSFGLDFDRDMLGVVEGVPEGAKHLGRTVSGGVSLRIKIDLADLFNALKEALTLFTSKAYQKTWPEVDNLTRVKDSVLIADLDALLDASLAASSGSNPPLLVNSGPRREDEQLAHLFAIGHLPRKSKIKSRSGSPYITRGAWDNWLKYQGQTADLSAARNTLVHALDETGEEIYRVSIYNCLAFEASLKNSAGLTISYILSQGYWYQANSNFISEVNRKLVQLAANAPLRRLKPWSDPEHEGDYNLRNICNGLVHFDAKNVSYGKGRSKFEFCDLMDPATKTLYFVKIAVNSSHMSHLVEQIRRTAELFFSADSEYRRALAKVVTKHNPALDVSWVGSRPRHGDWNLCMVPLGKSLAKLPFFAKCGVYRIAKELESRGHSFMCDER